MQPKQLIGITGIALLAVFFISLAYMAYLSYQSIEFDILQRLEAKPLILPTPIPSPESTSSADTQP